MSLPDHARYIHYHSIPNCPGCVKNFGTGIVCLTGATGSLLPVSARAGKPSVAPKRYHYQNFGQAGLGGSVTLSAAKTRHRRVAGTRPRAGATGSFARVPLAACCQCRHGRASRPWHPNDTTTRISDRPVCECGPPWEAPEAHSRFQFPRAPTRLRKIVATKPHGRSRPARA